ncbi:MAG: Gfo/Idh/MocA family oxidoreductase [Verrucomicrobiae bacterium]|nr:Gfo/Idh/MocA family oxidoreductase [Verrucomicrobiae bacterium]
MQKKRYALCGLSNRAVFHFAMPLSGKNHKGGTNFNGQSELVSILDVDETRVKRFLEQTGISSAYYNAKQFDRMVTETHPDVILVATPDYSHCEYIVRGLEKKCDVIVEKPMVINCRQIREVQAAEKKSGRQIRVAFNYRYTPTHKKLKRLILEGKLGKIINVEFVYNLDTFHGASYFYRWNRERSKSGGLNIHKCCHHFDLVNWFLDDMPETVFAFGALNYYGPHGALRPRDKKGRPLDPIEERKRCPYFQKHYAGKIDPDEDSPSTGWDIFKLGYHVQYPHGKKRYIYDDAIDIEDTYSANVKYSKGTLLNYSCNFSTPWEGYILAMNGTRGRIELSHHSNPDPTGLTAPAEEKSVITFFPLFGGKEEIVIPPVKGGHGGADFVIQNDLFGAPSRESRELQLTAGSEDGLRSVALGEAVMRSIKTRRPIDIRKLLAGR